MASSIRRMNVSKKSKVKKMTFRQRVRATADERLSAMIVAVREADRQICKESKTEINFYDVMKLACGGRTESLRNRLVTELANEHMAELEAIHNNQLNLDLGEDDAD